MGRQRLGDAVRPNLWDRPSGDVGDRREAEAKRGARRFFEGKNRMRRQSREQGARAFAPEGETRVGTCRANAPEAEGHCRQRVAGHPSHSKDQRFQEGQSAASPPMIRW